MFNHHHQERHGFQQPQPSSQPQYQPCQQNPLPDYCRKLTVRDSNGVLKEMIFPKALDLDRPKRARTTFSSDQLVRLEEAFRHNHYMVGRERNELAKALGLSETQVKVWFQNRRTKFKRDQGGAGVTDDAGAGGQSDSSPPGRPRTPPELLKLSKPQQGEAAAAAAAAAAYMYSMPWYRQSPTSSTGPSFLMPGIAQQSQVPPETSPQPSSQSSSRQQHPVESNVGHFSFVQSTYSLPAPYSQMQGLFKPRGV